MAKYKSDVDAVIAALRAVLNEAEAHKVQSYWKPKIFNRWIGQLPGAWRGRSERGSACRLFPLLARSVSGFRPGLRRASHAVT